MTPPERPADPAGTQPKVDPDALLPDRRGEWADEPEPAARAAATPPAPGAGAEEVAAPAAVALPRETQHTPRFQFLLGALLALGVVGVAAAALVAVRGDDGGGGAAWSRWQPSGDASVEQIATHVGRAYRRADGGQLVAVTGGPLEIADLPMRIALRETAAEGGDISILEGDGVLYRLCGLGPKCAIDKGKASQERHLLLRREALELALYTFRYDDDVDQVVVFMPPPLGQDPSQALLFRRGDVEPELARPLRATLAGRTPSVAGVVTSPDSAFVNRLTSASLYSFSLTQGNQDASVFLVLAPPGTAAPATGATAAGAATGAGTTTTP